MSHFNRSAGTAAVALAVAGVAAAPAAGQDYAFVNVADTRGPFSSLNPPAINDAGAVAFQALRDGGGSGIFTGPDPESDRVIATGDGLFGSAVVSAHLSGRDGLNDAGDVGFSYSLSDGRSGVAVTASRFTAAAGGGFDDAGNFAFGPTGWSSPVRPPTGRSAR